MKINLKDPIKSPALIECSYANMRLCEVDFLQVKPFASRAAKERVAIKPTGNTIWFHIKVDDVVVGCCGLYVGKKCRIKGDYMMMQHRGKGYGEFITQCRLLLAEQLEYEEVEVLTLHPKYYEKKGFTIVKERNKGVWYAFKKL